MKSAVGNEELLHERLTKEMFEDEIKTAYNNGLIKISNPENVNNFDDDDKKETFLLKEINKKLGHIFQVDMGKKPFFVIKIIKI